jgi:hypothetical protein
MFALSEKAMDEERDRIFVLALEKRAIAFPSVATTQRTTRITTDARMVLMYA